MTGVDLTLIAWFATLSPLERLRWNDRHVRMVLRLRRAFEMRRAG